MATLSNLRGLDILDLLKNVDGPGSGLDADTVQGVPLSGLVQTSTEKELILKSGNFSGDGSTKSFPIDGGYISDVGIVTMNGSDITSDVDLSDGLNIVFSTAPDSSDNISYYLFNAYKLYAPEVTFKQGRFVGDGSTKSFAIDGGYKPSYVAVFKNGVEVSFDVDISDGSNIVFDTAPDSGDNIDFYAFSTFKISTMVDLNTEQTIGGNKTFSNDVNIEDENNGLVLIDRSDTTKKYRLYVDNGDLGIEEV